MALLPYSIVSCSYCLLSYILIFIVHAYHMMFPCRSIPLAGGVAALILLIILKSDWVLFAINHAYTNHAKKPPTRLEFPVVVVWKAYPPFGGLSQHLFSRMLTSTMLLPRAAEAHHLLMHMVGFYDLASCFPTVKLHVEEWLHAAIEHSRPPRQPFPGVAPYVA